MSSKFKGLLDAAREREPEPVAKQQPVRGRPRGKRSNPDYEQVTAYIRRDTYTEVKIALLQQGEGQEFSELVEQMLTEWLSTQKAKKAKV